MDKQKLIQIIIKDLDELKFLTEEIADIQGDSTLIIDLALSKAKLLCQEIEVLREVTIPLTKPEEKQDEQDSYDEDDESDEINVSDPELEILNFESREDSEDEENSDFNEAEEDQDIDDADSEEDIPEPLSIQEEEEPELVIEETEESSEEILNEDQEEETEEEEEEEDFDQEDEDDEFESEEDDEEIHAEKEQEVQPSDLKKEVQFVEIKADQKTAFREINIDDQDDDLETIQFSPQGGQPARPVIHEIPKPENTAHEKAVVGEAFHKERSLNDALGENKTAESKLTNGPISNLRAAIGLNDRFLFIREIFDNNAEKYNTVIENLDKLETIQQAVDYLKANLSLQKNETSLKFVDLLKRRFSK